MGGMFPLSKILLPVDFSERCLGAARFAAMLGAHFKGELALVHVLEPLRYESSAPETARQQLEEFMREELAGVPVKRVLLEGDPARRIVEYAHQEQVNLIAMPTHGYGPFRRFILGSVAAKVLHDADCPVLTGVHMEEAPSAASIAIGTVACAVDLGPQTKKTLCWAARLACEFMANLVLIHAVPAIETRPGEYFDRDLAAQIAASGREELGKLCGAVRVETEIVVEGGDPPRVVCQAAERSQADVLIIGRGSAAGVFGRLRTNAYAIIRQSPCAVVSV